MGVKVDRSRWKLVGAGSSEWEYGLVESIIKYTYTYLGNIKRPNNN